MACKGCRAGHARPITSVAALPRHGQTGAAGGRAAVGRRAEHLPDEAAWRWRLQLQVERRMSPVRAAIVALSVAAWVSQPQPAGADPARVWATVAAAAVYVVIDFLLVYRRPDLAARFPHGSALADQVIILAWIWATGLGRSPFLPFIFIAVMAAPLRLPPAGAIPVTVVFAAVWGLVAPPDQRFFAGYIALLGGALTAWTSVIQNDRRASLRDPLTGCFTRPYAMFRIEHLLRQAALPFTVALLDLDGFKRVNDTYGHDAGDRVLQEATQRITAHLHGGDVLARYGGDEFLLVWVGRAGPAARDAADQMRAALADAPFTLAVPPAELRLTTSVGLTEAEPGLTVADLLRRADRSLYDAKNGKNRVVLAATPT